MRPGESPSCPYVCPLRRRGIADGQERVADYSRVPAVRRSGRSPPLNTQIWDGAAYEEVAARFRLSIQI